MRYLVKCLKAWKTGNRSGHGDVPLEAVIIESAEVIAE